jgi:adenosylhomocysteine nucleosidase
MTDSSSTDQDLAHADIGIVCALPIEIAPFLERCEKVRKYTGGEFVFRGGRFQGVRIAVAESGVGFARARQATQALIEAHTPPWILSCGLSGALLPEMKIGNIVIATSVIDTHGHEIKIDLNMPADPAKGLYCGRVLTADALVRTVQEKQELAKQREAIAVDMESLAVAQVATEAKHGFMAVRAISDDMSADLPPEVLSVVGPTGMTRLGAAFSAAWKRPGSVKEMWQLREAANTAAEKLASFLEGVVVQLSETLNRPQN